MAEHLEAPVLPVPSGLTAPSFGDFVDESLGICWGPRFEAWRKTDLVVCHRSSPFRSEMSVTCSAFTARILGAPRLSCAAVDRGQWAQARLSGRRDARVLGKVRGAAWRTPPLSARRTRRAGNRAAVPYSLVGLRASAEQAAHRPCSRLAGLVRDRFRDSTLVLIDPGEPSV
jgi:hypothetical protein